MAYEWPDEQCNTQGVPYSKLAVVRLEKNGESRRFRTQEEVDAAWADGWHEPGKPETADVPVVQMVEEAIEKVMPECKPKRGPGRPKKTRLFEKGK